MVRRRSSLLFFPVLIRERSWSGDTASCPGIEVQTIPPGARKSPPLFSRRCAVLVCRDIGCSIRAACVSLSCAAAAYTPPAVPRFPRPVRLGAKRCGFANHIPGPLPAGPLRPPGRQIGRPQEARPPHPYHHSLHCQTPLHSTACAPELALYLDQPQTTGLPRLIPHTPVRI